MKLICPICGKSKLEQIFRGHMSGAHTKDKMISWFRREAIRRHNDGDVEEGLI